MAWGVVYKAEYIVRIRPSPIPRRESSPLTSLTPRQIQLGLHLNF